MEKNVVSWSTLKYTKKDVLRNSAKVFLVKNIMINQNASSN